MIFKLLVTNTRQTPKIHIDQQLYDYVDQLNHKKIYYLNIETNKVNTISNIRARLELQHTSRSVKIKLFCPICFFLCQPDIRVFYKTFFLKYNYIFP